MKKLLLLLLSAMGFFASSQKLSTCWEELTGPNFIKAVEQAEGVCVVPIGVIEKHGTQLPLGTDVFVARDICIKAAEQSYAVVFPFYFVGQIFEAKHQAGTIAYSPELIYKMLDETCKEIARNGFNKIILYNTHGGNNAFMQYFIQAQLAQDKNYVVYLASTSTDEQTQKKLSALRVNKKGGHADEQETSNMLVIKPELVKLEKAKDESAEDMNRLQLKNSSTGIWWYSKYPNHYAGEASNAKKELGEISLAQRAYQVADVIKQVKKDSVAHKLQSEFFKEAQNPIETKIKK